MKKISELKKLELTEEDRALIEEDSVAWAKSKFVAEDSQYGVWCIYYDPDAVFGVPSIFFLSGQGNLSIYAAAPNEEYSEYITEVSEIKNGYCEVVFNNGEHCLLSGDYTVPMEIKKYMDRVWDDPLQIEDIPEDILSKYWTSLASVASNSLNFEFNKLKNSKTNDVGGAFVALMQGMALQEKNTKFQRIIARLQDKYQNEEDQQTQKWWQDKQARSEILDKIEEINAIEMALAETLPELYEKKYKDQLSEFSEKYDLSADADDEKLIETAASAYRNLMFYNYLFPRIASSVSSDKDLIKKHPELEDLSCKDFSCYVQKAVEMIKAIQQLGIEDKNVMEDFLPVLKAKSMTLPELDRDKLGVEFQKSFSEIFLGTTIEGKHFTGKLDKELDRLK